MYGDKGLSEVSALKTMQREKRFSSFNRLKPPHFPEFFEAKRPTVKRIIPC